MKIYTSSFFSRLILLSVCLTPCLDIRGNNREFMSLYSEHDRSWLFLENVIIKEPKKSVDTWLGTTGLLAIGSGATGLLTYKGTQHLMQSDTTLSKVGSATGAVALGVVQFIALRAYFLDKAEQSHFRSLMKAWPQLRNKVPQDVWASLDGLYQTLKDDSDTSEELIATNLSYLKSEIHARFPSRYAQDTGPFFTSRKLNFNITFDLYRALRDVVGLLLR